MSSKCLRTHLGIKHTCNIRDEEGVVLKGVRVALTFAFQLLIIALILVMMWLAIDALEGWR
jgi:predicted nucleic acid-binding Zn ribbon protein